MGLGEELLARLAESEHFPAAATAAQPSDEALARQRRLIRTIRISDVVGSAFWIYLILKIFVIDIDEVVLRAVFPAAVPLLNFRVFFYLGLLIALFVIWRRFWWVVLYVGFFPLLVLIWKLPWFFMKRRSWPLTFAGLQTLFSVISQLRYHLVHKSLWLFGSVAILVTDSEFVLIAAALLLLALLAIAFYRSVRRSFMPSAFISIQRRGIRRLLNAQPFRDFIALKDEYRTARVERYTSTEAIEVASAMSYGVIVTRGLYLWAYQLQRYRSRYSPSLVFAAVSFAWLFVGTVVTLALVNWAALEAFPDQYSVEADPSFAGMLVYAMSSLVLSDGGGIVAAGEIAYYLRLLAGAIGAIFLLTVFVNVVLTIRREREETAIDELVDELRTLGRSQEASFEREYAISVEAAQNGLISIGAGFASVLRYIADSLPSDFYEGPEPPTSPGRE